MVSLTLWTARSQFIGIENRAQEQLNTSERLFCCPSWALPFYLWGPFQGWELVMVDIPHPERLRRSRPWFKVWARHTIYGTTFNELQAIPRAVWFSLLCYACDSIEPGKIGMGSPIAVGYTNPQLAILLKLPVAEVGEGIETLIRTGKIVRDEVGIITVCKWQTYQSEYDRTKKYPRKSTLKPTPKTTKSRCIFPSVNRSTDVTEDTEVKEVTDKDMPLCQNPNSEKLQVRDSVRITQAEYDKLKRKYGHEATEQMLDKLDAWKGAKGKKYKSDYKAILNWVVDWLKKEPNNPITEYQTLPWAEDIKI